MKTPTAKNELSQFCKSVKKDLKKNTNYKIEMIKRVEVQVPHVTADSEVYMYGLSSF